MAHITKISPLAPKKFPDLPPIAGVSFSTAAAGVKYSDRTDVMLAHLCPGTTVAGVFTRSSTRSAAVLDCQRKLGSEASGAAAILVNSGNSNAFTGGAGQASVDALVQATAESLSVSEDRVFTSSTGVIGERLPHERIIETLDGLTKTLSEEQIAEAAQAIMTTDTFAKGATAQCDVNGKTVRIAGIAKGSGMIAPDMATMLVYIFTDIEMAQSDLQDTLSELTESTFNAITVDSDTSTSDTVLLCATGQSGATASRNDPAFKAALKAVMQDLAHQVVKDGEGASKFIEIRVTGAQSDSDARVHAMSIANSPLVKTAIAGEDPNWGRIVMAIGKSGAAADRDKLSISFGDILVAENGWVSPTYREEDAALIMKAQDILIKVDIGLGSGKSTVWTCDLTHGYIEINADYRS